MGSARDLEVAVQRPPCLPLTCVTPAGKLSRWDTARRRMPEPLSRAWQGKFVTFGGMQIRLPTADSSAHIAFCRGVGLPVRHWDTLVAMRLGARGDALARLRAAGELDVLVVGGGATGAGIVLEATLRGYRCALVEGADFASGTSSRSTKQIHGGLRYLIRGDVGFVQESLRERAFLLTHSTKLLTPLRHIAPLELTGGLTETAALLAAYDRLAEPSPLPASRALTRAEVREALPWLSGNEGGFEYYEAAASDTRLTLAVLTAAAECGAIVVNHLRVTAVEPPAAVAVDTLSRHSVTLRARHVVLAVGPWLQQFAHETGLPEVPLLPARGTHLVLRQPEPPLEIAVVLHHPADRRPLVLAPWHGHLLLGTTDAACDSDTIERPLPTAADVAYLLEGLRVLAPDWPVTVTAAWAGVRPLLAARLRA